MKVAVRDPALATAWLGLDPFDAAFAITGEVLRVAPGRETLVATVGGRRFVAKRHRGVGWREILKNLVMLNAPVLDAGHEYRAALRLAAAGVPGLNVAAFGVRGWNPARRQSFILCDEIVHEASLEERALQWRATPAPCPERWSTIASVAAIARAMHQAGVNHRDFYLCHLLCTSGGELRLIDLHRAQIRARVPRRWLVKDLGSLYFSAMDAGLTARDLLRFVRTYHGGRLPRGAAQWRLWRAVAARARRLYEKGRRLGLVGADAPGTILRASHAQRDRPTGSSGPAAEGPGGHMTEVDTRD